jgi:hypothetical protein
MEGWCGEKKLLPKEKSLGRSKTVTLGRPFNILVSLLQLTQEHAARSIQ